MEQESPSFWVDIKKYEDTLEKDPNSYCFAPLSELYRKIGMIDDAISIAKRGSELHPEYVGGYMALGRGYLEKGSNAEAREALEKVVRVTPENLLAQRLLSKIYLDAGETPSAEAALKAILLQNPEDSESRMLLDSLIRTASPNIISSAGPEKKVFVITAEAGLKPEEEFDALEDLEEILDLEGCEIVEEGEFEQETPKESGNDSPPAYDLSHEAIADDKLAEVAHEGKDPLTTVTLAELYLSQGFPKKALQIFSELAETDPSNQELKNRIASLKQEIDEGEGSSGEIVQEVEYASGQEDLTSVEDLAADSPHLHTFSGDAESDSGALEIPNASKCVDIDTVGFEALAAGIEVVPEVVPEAVMAAKAGITSTIDAAQGDNMGLLEEGAGTVPSDEQVVRTLEIWLENIKRRR
jgi:tetratricopeptide (TPR) repeat protein